MKRYRLTASLKGVTILRQLSNAPSAEHALAEFKKQFISEGETQPAPLSYMVETEQYSGQFMPPKTVTDSII